MDFHIHDEVYRISHQKDILFRIESIEGDRAVLFGKFVRLKADASISDLSLASRELQRGEEKKERVLEQRLVSRITRYQNALPGKILHLDGDSFYTNKCKSIYEQLGIFAVCVTVEEKEMPNKIIELIREYTPDIVVITGHDAYNQKGKKELEHYLNSKFFYQTVMEIRKYYSKDSILVIAGACQSHYEALLGAGANFAMSKDRVNIHAFDPAIIAIKAAITPFNHLISIKDIFSFTWHKNEGIGGIETMGKMRLFL